MLRRPARMRAAPLTPAPRQQTPPILAEAPGKARDPRHAKNKDLRHENDSRLALAGVHPKNVQERLGQSSIRVTMDVYSHLMPGMDSQAVDVIDRMLKPTPVVAQPANAESGK